MVSVAATIYAAAGAPPMPDTTTGVCRLCGEEGSGVPFGAWVKDTFTDHDKLHPGAIICTACQFCASETTPTLAARVGKEKPQKFRNYSHIVAGGVWHPLSKRDKATMRTLLVQSPDVALIAISGQKHLFFRAAPGWWQIEEIPARPFPDALADALAVVTPLLTTFSKAEVESGRYSHQRILVYGLTAWMQAEARLRELRGSLTLVLALFLAQKEETDGA